MTYDVLLKVSKKDLVAWMRRNVFLPEISDEEFLREVKLGSLLEKEKELLEEDLKLNKRLEQAASDNQIESMRLMVQSQKLNEQIEKISKEISELMSGKECED